MVTFFRMSEDYTLEIIAFRSESAEARASKLAGLLERAKIAAKYNRQPVRVRSASYRTNCVILRYHTDDEATGSLDPIRINGREYFRPVLKNGEYKEQNWVRPQPRAKHIKLCLVGVDPYHAGHSEIGPWDVVLNLAPDQIIVTGLDDD